jgi:hypothetical protein
MKWFLFVFTAAAVFAQSANQCSDLTRFQMPGATIEITRAERMAAGAARGGRGGPGPMLPAQAAGLAATSSVSVAVLLADGLRCSSTSRTAQKPRPARNGDNATVAIWPKLRFQSCATEGGRPVSRPGDQRRAKSIPGAGSSRFTSGAGQCRRIRLHSPSLRTSC